MLPARLRVLLVEDDPVAARILTRTLENVPSPQFSVTLETDLAGARARVRASEPFDVAILDLNLPDSAGIGTLGAMLAASNTLPIVVMTGDDDPGVADLALEAGAQDYLVKGETSERIVTRAIRYAITRKLADLERQSISERLNANLAAENKRLDEESALARAMQFGLLPAQDKLAQYPQTRGLRVDAFFEPSSQIGGDLWGCAELDALRTIFYSFDFSGHGVGAALNVFRLHALMSELGGQIIDPAATLSRFNKALVSLLPRGQYATIFLGVVDTAAGTLTWSAGGAPPPFLLDRQGRLKKLDSKGKPLGLSASAHYTNRAIAFPEGSSLFLYSDALTETPLRKGDPLGEEGLADLVKRFHSPSGIDVQALITDFLKAARPPVDDDMTAVAVARLPVPVEARAARSQASAPLLLTSRRLEVVEIGLAPPYSGFVEIGADGLSDVGRACLDAAERGGLCLSLTAVGAWACCASHLLGAAMNKRFGGDRDWEAVDLCLSEAVTNAIIHGSLAVDSSLRETKEGLAAYAQAIQAGLGDPARAGKRVEITAIPLPDDEVQITVYDRGGGFDFEATLKTVLAQNAKHGRGLGLINRIAKSVSSLDGGRTLEITI